MGFKRRRNFVARDEALCCQFIDLIGRLLYNFFNVHVSFHNACHFNHTNAQLCIGIVSKWGFPLKVYNENIICLTVHNFKIILLDGEMVQ